MAAQSSRAATTMTMSPGSDRCASLIDSTYGQMACRPWRLPRPAHRHPRRARTGASVDGARHSRGSGIRPLPGALWAVRAACEGPQTGSASYGAGSPLPTGDDRPGSRCGGCARRCVTSLAHRRRGAPFVVSTGRLRQCCGAAGSAPCRSGRRPDGSPPRCRRCALRRSCIRQHGRDLPVRRGGCRGTRAHRRAGGGSRRFRLDHRANQRKMPAMWRSAR